MPYQYVYITCCLILFLFWILIFQRRKDLRREMLWSSFWGMPFGCVDFFLVPNYWNPDSLFGLIKIYGVGIESFIFIFLMSGIASVAYEFLRKKRPVRLPHIDHYHFWLLLFTTLSFVFLTLCFPSKAIYNLMVVGAAGALITAYLRKDLIRQIIVSAFVFSFLYFGVFILTNLLFPGFVEYSYNLKNLWGIMVLGVPLEEIGAAFFVGAYWSTIYEYTRAYRESP